MAYNPFDKPLTELTQSDIEQLIVAQIAEGWYIEYKTDIPKNSSDKYDNLRIA